MVNKRLEKISQLIDNNYSVVDVGCDHGYLSMFLREKGNKELLINCDNKLGPLNSAKENLKYLENIKFYCCDGLTAVKEQCDVINIAGMGFHTAINILSDKIDYARKAKIIILQVNNDVDKLRLWLNKNDFKIIDEVIVFDYKYYQIIVCENGKEELTKQEIEYGPCLLKKKDNVFIDYLNQQKEQFESILPKINKSDPDYFAIKDKIEEIKKILNS